MTIPSQGAEFLWTCVLLLASSVWRQLLTLRLNAEPAGWQWREKGEICNVCICDIDESHQLSSSTVLVGLRLGPWSASWRRAATESCGDLCCCHRAQRFGIAEAAQQAVAWYPMACSPRIRGLQKNGEKELGPRKAPKKGVPQITAEDDPKSLYEFFFHGVFAMVFLDMFGRCHVSQEKQLAEDGLYGQGSPDDVVASRFSVEVTRRRCLAVASKLLQLLSPKGPKFKNGASKCFKTQIVVHYFFLLTKTHLLNPTILQVYLQTGSGHKKYSLPGRWNVYDLGRGWTMRSSTFTTNCCRRTLIQQLLVMVTTVANHGEEILRNEPNLRCTSNFLGWRSWCRSFKENVFRCSCMSSSDLQERSKVVEGTPKCWFPNSFFWPKLSGNNKDRHKRLSLFASAHIFEIVSAPVPVSVIPRYTQKSVFNLIWTGV